jgi:hypothetical protein
MIRIGIRTYNHKASGLFIIYVWITGRSASKRGQHCLHGWRMAKSCTVVYMVTLHNQTWKFLLYVSILICRLCRT